MLTRKTTIAALGAAAVGLGVWVPFSAAAKPGSPGRAVGRTMEHRDQGRGKEHAAKGRTKGCNVHSVAYIASGVLVSDSLTKNANGTYSGEVAVEVKRANHYARGELGKTVTYKVSEVRVVLGIGSQSGQQPTVEGLKAGDRAKVIGRITFLPRRCSQAGFTPTVTVKRLIFHEAA